MCSKFQLGAYVILVEVTLTRRTIEVSILAALVNFSGGRKNRYIFGSFWPSMYPIGYMEVRDPNLGGRGAKVAKVPKM